MPTAHSVGVGGDVEEAPVRRTRRGVRGIRIDGLVAPGAEVRSKPPAEPKFADSPLEGKGLEPTRSSFLTPAGGRRIRTLGPSAEGRRL